MTVATTAAGARSVSARWSRWTRLGVLDAFDRFPHEISSTRHRTSAAPRDRVHLGSEPRAPGDHWPRTRWSHARAAASLVRPDGPRALHRAKYYAHRIRRSRRVVIRACRLRPPRRRGLRRCRVARGPGAARWSKRIAPRRGDRHLRRSLPLDAVVWPVPGRVTSRFGDRVGRFHAGIDIAAPEGTSVVAVAAGKVVIAESLAEFGNVVVVDHGDGCTTLSARLRETARRGR